MAVSPSDRAQVVAEMTRLVASMTGDEAAAPQIAEALVAAAEDQVPDDPAGAAEE